MSRNRTVREVFDSLIEARLLRVHTSMPAKIDKYDSSKQTADVKPLLKLPALQPDGSIKQQSLPVLTNIPVEFPGAGDFRIVWPLKRGNTGVLTFAESSLDDWFENGKEIDASDLRRFHLSDGIFRPGLNSKNKAWQDAAGDFITLGKDSEAAEWVALANKVKDRLDSLASSYNAHTHTVSGLSVTPSTGAQIGSTTTSAGPTNSGDNAVASASVKIKG